MNQTVKRRLLNSHKFLFNFIHINCNVLILSFSTVSYFLFHQLNRSILFFFDQSKVAVRDTIVFRYRKPKEKKPLVETMRVLLPMLQQRLMSLMPDASQESVLLQKLIMKIFFALVQASFRCFWLYDVLFDEWVCFSFRSISRWSAKNRSSNGWSCADRS